MISNFVCAQIEYDYAFQSGGTSSSTGETSISLGILGIVLFVVVAVIAVAALVLSIINMIKINKQNSSIIALGKNAAIGAQDRSANSGSNTGVVFCKNCGNQYGMGLSVCPYCGAKR
ncbi:MAG: hypothetical protein Q4F06_06400 [Eubacteriales bacterium]|nr:hypothetical protein [Eubacteriales bacterium]